MVINLQVKWAELAHLLSGLISGAEGGRDFGFDVGGSPFLRHNVSKHVDEDVIVFQQRHCAVPPFKRQVGPHLSNGHVHLAWVLTHARLNQNQGTVKSDSGIHSNQTRHLTKLT